ncbi:MAG: AAA family ATPase [Patescibacteria group bacterium]
MTFQKIDLNPQFQKAIALMESTNKNVFITGRAGTGKSTLLTYFRTHTKKKVVVLAPTGVAALNVQGQTIHSFFRFKPNITLQNVKRLYKKDNSKNLYQKIDTIIIDEISMVRSDLLDCVDKFLRLNRNSDIPFGGVQIIFIGDLYQLPPVVTGSEREIFKNHYSSQYFFDAKVFEKLNLEFVELEKVYRQKDDAFIGLLNTVRNNSATEQHLSEINKRYNPHFVANPESFTIHLTTTNDLADTINKQQLSLLKQKQHTYHGRTTGSFEKNSLPTEVELSVKVGAQVMMLNNDNQSRWVNGTIGRIVDIEKKDQEDIIQVQTRDGKVRGVAPFTWELFNFSFDEKKNSLVSETVGTFTQYPLKLAWAVTIHKSQGKTFDNVVVDIGKGTFVHGQLYVALSRCTSFEGIILKQPIAKKHIFMDWRVVKFVTRFQYQKSENLLPLEEKIKILQKAVDNKEEISITYLKASDEKSKRIIKPFRVGKMEYQGREFLGVEAYDKKRQEERVFRVDRILEMTGQ